eukprot:12013269-Karenia_brevis.AAC.1
MPMFCAMKKAMRDRIEGIGDLDFMADFADDGVIGGDYRAVLKALKGEIALGSEYGVRCNYSKMVVYVLGGQAFQGDLSEFERMGIKVDYSGNVKFMQ